MSSAVGSPARHFRRWADVATKEFVLAHTGSGGGGEPGPPGPPGEDGEDGTRWFDGDGPPMEPIAGANPGDYYLDNLSGDVWVLAGAFRLTGYRAIIPVRPRTEATLALVPGGPAWQPS